MSAPTFITPEIATRIQRGRPYPETARALAEKWGPVFDVDPSWLVSHAYVESTNRPLINNESGNAWGLMQMKPGTAGDVARRMRKNKIAMADPRVKEVFAACWHGRPEDLLNPDLNVMFAAYYLGLIKAKMEKEFGRGGDQQVVAASYNQGPGAMRAVLRKEQKSGEFEPTDKMKLYLAKIAEAKAKGFA